SMNGYFTPLWCTLCLLLHREHIFSFLCRAPRSSTLFPYTTLFRSANPHLPRGPAVDPAGDLRGRLRGRGHALGAVLADHVPDAEDRKSTRLNSSHVKISYAVFCLKKKIHNVLDIA